MKVCAKCNTEKDLHDFYDRKLSKDGKGPYCKQCHDMTTRKWRANNRERHRQVNNLRRKNKKHEMVIQFGAVCYDCQQPYPDCVFDFHHLRDKDVNPHIAFSWSKEKRDKEFSKCIMLCANCHRIRHFDGG